MLLQYFFYIIVYFWLLSRRGANKKKYDYFLNDYLGAVRLCQRKIPKTPSGIETAIFQLVAQCCYNGG